MHIFVDEELKYRSGDDTHRWLRSELRYRKLRPIADAYCSGTSKNARGLSDWIVRRARADFPEASSVSISCSVTAWPEVGESKMVHTRTVRAPEWL